MFPESVQQSTANPFNNCQKQLINKSLYKCVEEHIDIPKNHVLKMFLHIFPVDFFYGTIVRNTVSTSAIFGDPYYGPKDLLYPKSTTQSRLRDLLHPTCKSTTLPSPVLANNWFSSVSTHSSSLLQGSKSHQFPPAWFNALILQHPVFALSSSSLL